jgi:hypothetical protein
MDEINLRRVRDSSCDEFMVERRLGVGGVRDAEESVESGVGDADS